jgi:hypothetical protein
MAGDAKDLPHPTAPNFLDRTQQELRRLLGFTGNRLDRAVTWRDVQGGNVTGGQTVVYQGGSGGGGGGGVTPDLTPPPDVTGLAASAGISHVFVQWDAPVYTQGHGPGSTRIYAARRNPGDANAVFADAELSWEAFHPAVLAAIPSDPNIRWHLWAKYVTVDGVESVSPAGGTNGVIATTGQNVTNLLQILTGQITTSELAAALNTRINLIDAGAGTAGSVNARIATETTARTSADSALSSTISAVSATANANTAAIATETSVRAAADGHLGALYSVRVQLTHGGRTVMGGFGISGTSVGGAGPTIDFGVVANKFWIGAPAGSTGIADVLPFVVQTTDTVVNGVTIPRGVYMDAAFINNLTAMVARLGNAWIDNAMIANLSAAKITAGTVAVGVSVQSSGYVPGSAGWRIDGSGWAEFSNATIRNAIYTGTIYAGAGTIGGITIDATRLRNAGYVAATSGFALNSDGTAEFNSGTTFRGTIDVKSAASGARLEITNGAIRGYYASNALAFEIST